MLRVILIIGTISLLFSCQRLERQNNESDEQMFSLKDNSNLLNQNNPFRIRDSIKYYAIIPNVSLYTKLKKFNDLQDSLQKEISSENEEKYAEIEKYNYLIIKYLTNLIENLKYELLTHKKEYNYFYYLI